MFLMSCAQKNVTLLQSKLNLITIIRETFIIFRASYNADVIWGRNVNFITAEILSAIVSESDVMKSDEEHSSVGFWCGFFHAE